MTAYADIEKAIVAAVIAANNDGTPLGMPGESLPDSAKGDGLWLQMHNLRADSSVATLGSAGEDNHPGFIQIDVNYPVDKGTGDVLEKSDVLMANFTAGTALSYNSQIVNVISSSLSSGRIAAGFYRVSITINYYARTTRA